MSPLRRVIFSSLFIPLIACACSNSGRVGNDGVGEDRRSDHTSQRPSVHIDDVLEGTRWERWVGAASSEDCRKFIVPLFDREGIPYIPLEKSLGIIGFFTDSSEHAQRARELLKRDAMKYGYYCWTRDGSLNYRNYR